MEKISIIVPCYNEEKNVGLFFEVADAAFANKTYDYEIVYVNDGSKDTTWQLIKEEHERNSKVFGLNLAANVGHQAALLAGLMTARGRCDVSISMDADLQDDMDAMDRFLEKYPGSNLVLTLGGRGSLFANADGVIYQPAIQTDVVDTTAAGDAFTAAMTLEYLRTGDVCRAVRYGNAVGAITITGITATVKCARGSIGVALDARYLHQSAHRVAGKP